MLKKIIFLTSIAFLLQNNTVFCSHVSLSKIKNNRQYKKTFGNPFFLTALSIPLIGSGYPYISDFVRDNKGVCFLAGGVLASCGLLKYAAKYSTKFEVIMAKREIERNQNECAHKQEEALQHLTKEVKSLNQQMNYTYELVTETKQKITSIKQGVTALGNQFLDLQTSINQTDERLTNQLLARMVHMQTQAIVMNQTVTDSGNIIARIEGHLPGAASKVIHQK